MMVLMEFRSSGEERKESRVLHVTFDASNLKFLVIKTYDQSQSDSLTTSTNLMKAINSSIRQALKYCHPSSSRQLVHRRALKTPADMANHYNTIIIGAGISGLACAAKLYDHEIFQKHKRLLVLEARDRIGGRIESIHLGGNRLDTGANWIHGIGTEDEPNPLIGILPDKPYQELSRSISFSPSPVENGVGQDWVVVDANKSLSSPKEKKKDLVIPSNISSELFGFMWALIGSLHEFAAKISSEDGKHVSILEVIQNNQEFKSAFNEIPKEYHQILRALPQFVEGMEAGPLNASSAEHSADHPGMGILEYDIDEFDGEQVFLKDGYTPVVEEVAKKLLQKGQIKFGVEVKTINWDRQPLTIATSEGQYTSDRVICTIPLGVLQHHQRPSVPRLFYPDLPPQKKEAIQSLGFGTLDKIFLVYTAPWWKTEPYQSILKKGITKIRFPGGDDPEEAQKSTEPDTFWGFTDELPGIEVDVDGSAHPGIRGLFVVNLHSLSGFPVLSAFASCSNAVHIEGLSDSAASMIVHRALTKWLGQEPPLPDNVYVTRWASDRYSTGSYSHMIKGVSEKKHREEFQEPLRNEFGMEIRFAGEHTSRNHFATVHGALLSGWREADAVLRDEEKVQKQD